MEVLNASEAILCNAEVLQFLKEAKQKLPKVGRKHQPSGGSAKAATIILETLTYLEKTPAGRLTPANFKEFAAKLKENSISLTLSEVLQVVNMCPRTAVEIQLLIEDSEERLTDDQVELLLALVRTELLQEDPEAKDSDDQE